MLTIGLVGCGSGTPPPVYVGHIAPLRGDHQQDGQSARNGIDLAVKELNKDEKAKLDNPIVVLHANATNAQAFEGEAIRLAVINQVVALLGGNTAREVKGLKKGGVPVISSAGMREADNNKMVFLTGLTPTTKGQLLAEFAGTHLGARLSGTTLTLAVSQLASPTGMAPLLGLEFFAAELLAPLKVIALADSRRPETAVAVEAFTKSFVKKMNASLPGSGTFGVKSWQFQSEEQLVDLLKLLSKQQPDAIFLAGDGDSLWKVRTAFSDKHVPILFAGPEGSQSVLMQNLPTSDAIYLVSAWVPDNKTPQNEKFIQDYRQKFETDPEVHAALAFDNARILFEAMRKTENFFTTKQIQEKLGELKDFPILMGKGSFDESGMLRRPAFIVQLRQGQAVTVEKYEPK